MIVSSFSTAFTAGVVGFGAELRDDLVHVVADPERRPRVVGLFEFFARVGAQAAVAVAGLAQCRHTNRLAADVAVAPAARRGRASSRTRRAGRGAPLAREHDFVCDRWYFLEEKKNQRLIL